MYNFPKLLFGWRYRNPRFPVWPVWAWDRWLLPRVIHLVSLSSSLSLLLWNLVVLILHYYLLEVVTHSWLICAGCDDIIDVFGLWWHCCCFTAIWRGSHAVLLRPQVLWAFCDVSPPPAISIVNTLLPFVEHLFVSFSWRHWAFVEHCRSSSALVL